MSIKQISVILDEQSGTFSGMAKVLSDKNVEMRALTLYEAGNFRVVRIIADNVLWATSALWEAGFTVDTADVAAVEIPDEEGGLSRVLNVLERAGIEIKYMYPVLSRKKTVSLGGGIPMFVFKFEDDEKASEILRLEGIKVLRQGDLSEL
ncbi:MAG: hypothetical protein IJ697_05065 [Synergistaceae bacterium]|nr:hypothetical protein [Synergistaceae bacterium]